MSIFNSLGSNYSWRFVWKNLFAWGSSNSINKAEAILGEHFSGNATLTYKGREALELSLRQSQLPPLSQVGINGFTCWVVYEAVIKAGYKPVFIDLAKNSMHFDVDQLAKYKDLSAVVVQNTLGYPVDMVVLENYCKQNGIMIIEDLAHSFGAMYGDGREAGTVGAFTMLSFSQDKPLDIVAGGASINRTGSNNQAKSKLPPVSLWQLKKNRDYPFWTGLIRLLYPTGLGRVLHYVLKHLHLMASPLGDAGVGIHRMSKSTAKLLLDRWDQRQVELNHRREIAAIYQEGISSDLKLIKNIIGQPTYLRFPLFVGNRQSLINYLRNNNIHIGDTWYDAPIAPKRYLAQTDYEVGSCPEAENISANIVNLPTHRYITPQIAGGICAKIKQWQASNPSR